MAESGRLVAPEITLAINERTRAIIAPTKNLLVEVKDSLSDTRHQVGSLETNCSSRHNRSNGLALEAKQLAQAATTRLVAVSGEHGKNGKIGDLRVDVDELKDWRKTVDRALFRSMAGAIGGAGAGAGIIELVKLFI